MGGYTNRESAPHPGELRHRVEIGYTENNVNENGYPEPNDIVVCQVWASAADADNRQFRSADTANVEASVLFAIRYRDDIKPGMWVRFRGETWIISALNEYGFKRGYLGMKASVVKGVSG